MIATTSPWIGSCDGSPAAGLRSGGCATRGLRWGGIQSGRSAGQVARARGGVGPAEPDKGCSLQAAPRSDASGSVPATRARGRSTVPIACWALDFHTPVLPGARCCQVVGRRWYAGTWVKVVRRRFVDTRPSTWPCCMPTSRYKVRCRTRASRICSSRRARPHPRRHHRTPPPPPRDPPPAPPSPQRRAQLRIHAGAHCVARGTRLTLTARTGEDPAGGCDTAWDLGLLENSGGVRRLIGGHPGSARPTTPSRCVALLSRPTGASADSVTARRTCANARPHRIAVGNDRRSHHEPRPADLGRGAWSGACAEAGRRQSRGVSAVWQSPRDRTARVEPPTLRACANSCSRRSANRPWREKRSVTSA